MNLRAIADSAIQAINPSISVTYQASNGYITLADGSREPLYDETTLSAQVQALSGGDLRQLDGVNLNGTARAIYLSGHIDAVVRDDNKGGDILTFDDGSTWLVVKVLETWGTPDAGGWCKVAAQRQSGIY